MRAVWFLAWSWFVVLTLGMGCAHGPRPQDPSPVADALRWEQSLSRVVKGVVVLRVTVPRDFDTEMQGSYVGTGFIVDAERGLILTNRHLVQPGPVVAEAVFLNHEEVPVQAIYRDPVHDFGFFRYDPAAVHFAEIEEIPLAPEAARVGVEIRVVGNDAGEKLSILSGTLARLDRAAPIYDSIGYNDFNTFYYQAASGTSGGSSGSPVVDIEGRAIALNAGGAFFADSSFFLPLHRVVLAMQAIQAAQPVKRGTLQTIFLYRPYDELRRLGLPQALEARARAALPGGVGMLAVEEVVPGGPGDGVLEPGDVLFSLDGAISASFDALADALDNNVGGAVRMEIIRAGEVMAVELQPRDLHAISPHAFIEVGGALIHPLSYQQSRNFYMPTEGLYVASAGYMLRSAGVPWGALLRAIDGVEVQDIDTLWSVLTARPDRDRLAIRYVMPFDLDQEYVAVAYLDRLWYPTRRCRMEPYTGEWPCEEAGPARDRWSPEPGEAEMDVGAGESVPEKLAASLVMVECNVPFRVEGVQAAHYVGTGLVVDTTRGLVVTDRDTVPILLGDVQLVFGGTLRVPGEVVYVHPTHNFTVVSYDPALIGATDVKAAQLSRQPLRARDKLWLVGRDRSFNLVSAEGSVARIAPLVQSMTDPPAFRDTNVDVIEFASAPGTVGGALSDLDGAVRALWVSYGYEELSPKFRGLPADVVWPVVEALRRGETPQQRTLGVELSTINLADARDRGLPAERLALLQRRDAERRQALVIRRVYSGFPAQGLLRGGDVLLSVDGAAVGFFRDVEALSQKEVVTVEVLRDGAVVAVEVATVALDGRGVDRVVSWAGMLLHEPHLAIAMQRSTEWNGVYVSDAGYGSPASHYGVPAAIRIISVDHQPTPDLDTFLRLVAAYEDGQAVRLGTRSLDGLEQVITLKTEYGYWPTWELRFSEGAWQRRMVSQ